jgi:glycosyltransferase involved in cell wall biosynthesis
MMRILLVEAGLDAPWAADYVVHAGLVEAASQTSSLEVMSISNPGQRDIDRKGIDRAFVPISTKGPNRAVRQLKFGAVLSGAIREAVRIGREFAPDVVYSSAQRRDSLLARMVSWRIGAPLVLHLHYPYGPWLGRLAAATVKSADHVVTVSEFVRETTLVRGVKDDRATTVYVSIPSLAEPADDRLGTRAALDVDPLAPVVASVGRLDPNKGFQWLLRVLPRILPDVPDLRVLICGSSVHAPGFDNELRSLASELGLDEHVRFLGQRTDVQQILHASDVFCLPTEMEAFGLVFPEAMRAGLPVVAARSGGVPEVVLDGVTGLLSLPRDLDGLEANLRRVLLDRDLARSLGDAGRERLRTAFDPVRAGQRWLGVLETAVAASKGR